LGITLYALIIWALSFSISIDGIASSASHFDGVYGCCNPTAPEVHNFTIYDIQNLLLGDHVLVLRLLDTSGFLASGSSGSTLSFDYAVVNETATPPSSPYVSLLRFRRSNLIRLSSHRRLGPALGGALGGMAALALAALAVIYIRRRAHKVDAQQIDPYNPTIVSDKPEQEPPVIAAGLRHDSAPVPPLGEGSNTRATAADQLHAEPDIPPTTTSLAPSPSFPLPHPDTLSSPALIPRDEAARQVLGTLYDLGVPGTQIASLVETMRQTTQGTHSGILAEAANEPQPPPYAL
jgi:hypothetical protein